MVFTGFEPAIPAATIADIPTGGLTFAMTERYKRNEK